MAINQTDNCYNLDANNIDYKNPRSILNGILSLFKVPKAPTTPYPLPVILASVNRPGLSPSEIASRIIKRQSEAGIPVGPLPSGAVSPAEIMERIRMEEVVNALVTEMAIDVAIPPGTALQGTGTSPTGPVQVFGTTLGISTGSAMAR